MRGEVCVGSASFLSFTAMLLLIFVGQINTSTIPRGISMAKVNVSGYGDGLAKATSDQIEGLYTTNASAPLEVSAGLRQIYEFGLYSHCAYVVSSTTNKLSGICTNHTVGDQFRPYDAITLDMLPNYTSLTSNIILDTTFRDSSYLGSSSKAAYYMLLIGTICAGLAMLTGVAKHTLTFFASTSFSIIGALMVLIAASIWTVIIKKTEGINTFVFGAVSPQVPLGITVSVGPALFMIWAAFACLLVSILPYMVSCCTYRG